MIRRCLQPLPLDRYQTAGELATDLQAVADDLPLRGTREPWPARAAGWLRRRRRKLGVAAVVLVAVAAVAGSVLSFWNENTKIYNRCQAALDKGLDAERSGDFATAKIHFDDAAQFADGYSQTAWGHLTRLTPLTELGSIFIENRKSVERPRNLEEMKFVAREKSHLAERHERTRRKADTLFEAAGSLRFRLLLGEGTELVQLFEDLQQALAPFSVLKNEDWTKRDHNLSLLDRDRRERLLNEVNELLFLWIAEIDESMDSAPAAEKSRGPHDRDAVETALLICEKALLWVEPKDPWLAMMERIKRHQMRPNEVRSTAPLPPAVRGEATSFNVNQEKSAPACFQWGVLAMRGAGLTGRSSGCAGRFSSSQTITGISSFWRIWRIGPTPPTKLSAIIRLLWRCGPNLRGCASAEQRSIV